MATTTVCPFCFHRIDPSRLWFQCLGRGNAECKKSVDEARKKLTKSMRETYPTFPPPDKVTGPAKCPECGGTTNLRACPDCHTALPLDFADSKSPMIGLVGSKGSGKTVLMTVLVKQLKDVVGKRYDAAIRLATDNPDGHQGLSDYQAKRESPLYKDRGAAAAHRPDGGPRARRAAPAALAAGDVPDGTYRGQVHTALLRRHRR